MKALIIDIFIMGYVARLSNGWGSHSGLHADGVVTSSRKSIHLTSQTTGTLHHIGERMKHLEGTISELFTKIADTQNVCHKKENSLKCCADDFFKNYMCVEFELASANFTVKIVFEVNNTTFIDEEISGDKNIIPLPS